MNQNATSGGFEAEGAHGPHGAARPSPTGNPYLAGAQAHAGPDLDAGAPVLRSNEDQRLNRKALGFLAGIIVLLVFAAVFIYRGATSDEARGRRSAEEQVVIPELPREPLQPPRPRQADLAPEPRRQATQLPALPPLPVDDRARTMASPRPADFPREPREPTLIERRMGSKEGLQSRAEEADDSLAQDPFIQALMQANGIAPAKPAPGDQDRKGNARFLSNPDTLLIRGTYIRCVLAMRIVTDVPGFTSCVVAEPVYSVNGRRLLVPKGSRILGRYDTDAAGPRVAVAWDRITTPTGIDIDMAGPGVDGLGGAGHPGAYSAHWPSRIGSALLISLISDVFKYEGERHGPTSTAYYGNGAVVEQPFESNTARALQRLADQAVDRSASRPATVTINQGAVLNVYVAQDIDFTEVLPRID